MIVGGVLLVEVVGDAVQGDQGVHPHAPLEASAGDAADRPEHLDLLDQIVLVARHVRPAVDPAAGQVGDRRGQVSVVRVVGQVVGGGRRVDVRADGRMIDHAGHPLAHEVDLGLELSQALDVLLAGHHVGASRHRRWTP